MLNAQTLYFCIILLQFSIYNIHISPYRFRQTIGSKNNGDLFGVTFLLFFISFQKYFAVINDIQKFKYVFPLQTMFLHVKSFTAVKIVLKFVKTFSALKKRSSPLQKTAQKQVF